MIWLGAGLKCFYLENAGAAGSSIYRDRDKSYYPYNKRLSKTRDDREPIRVNRSKIDLDDIIIESRGEAEEVLDSLVELNSNV